MRPRALALAVALLLPAMAPAQGVLEGQKVELRALVIPEPGAEPQVASLIIELVGGPEVELPSMHAVRAAAGDDIANIVEISVDIGADDILIGYQNATPTSYTDGFFSGYSFTFPGLPPEMVAAAYIDPVDRLPGMQDSRLSHDGDRLMLHVGGLAVQREAKLRIRFPGPRGPTS
jgi:hypothetical protein